MSPTRDAEAAKRFFRKALHSMDSSASQARTIEKQVAQPMDVADLTITTSAPRGITVD